MLFTLPVDGEGMWIFRTESHSLLPLEIINSLMIDPMPPKYTTGVWPHFHDITIIINYNNIIIIIIIIIIIVIIIIILFPLPHNLHISARASRTKPRHLHSCSGYQKGFTNPYWTFYLSMTLQSSGIDDFHYSLYLNVKFTY